MSLEQYKAKGIRLESIRDPRKKIFEITTSNDLAIITGTSNIPLTRDICRILGEDFGIASGRFYDGSIATQLPASVDGKDVFVIQSTPPNADNLMELCDIIQACHLSDAKKITAVIPFLYGSRSDRKDSPRVSITAKLVADLLSTAGASRFATVDIHAEQETGFFKGPLNVLHARKVQAQEILSLNLNNPCYLAVDIGGDKKIAKFAISAGADPDDDVATVIKERTNGEARPKYIQGKVSDRDVVIVDDIINTGDSMLGAAKVARNEGAQRIIGVITHGMMADRFGKVGVGILQRIQDSPVETLYLTDTIKQPQAVWEHPKIKIISVAPLIAKAIKRMHEGKSLSPDLVD